MLFLTCDHLAHVTMSLIMPNRLKHIYAVPYNASKLMWLDCGSLI